MRRISTDKSRLRISTCWSGADRCASRVSTVHADRWSRPLQDDAKRPAYGQFTSTYLQL